MPTENILREAFDEMLALCEVWERRLPEQDCRPKPHCECDCYEHRAHRAAIQARAALEREKVCDGRLDSIRQVNCYRYRVALCDRIVVVDTDTTMATAEGEDWLVEFPDGDTATVGEREAIAKRARSMLSRSFD